MDAKPLTKHARKLLQWREWLVLGFIYVDKDSTTGSSIISQRTVADSEAKERDLILSFPVFALKIFSALPCPLNRNLGVLPI